MSNAEEDVFRTILESWSQVSGLTFTGVSSGGDIQAYWYRDRSNPTARVLNFPGATPESGDIQLGLSVGGD